MKEFFKWVLAFLLFILGFIGILLTKGKLSDIITFPMSLLIYFPAVLWWFEYFDELFDK